MRVNVVVVKSIFIQGYSVQLQELVSHETLIRNYIHNFTKYMTDKNYMYIIYKVDD